MTIDSGWVRVFKEECPDAFQTSYPFAHQQSGSSTRAPHVAYIDGMPLLMTSEYRGMRTWDDLLRNNFARHITRYFRLGCRAVVLAFDDYDRVPMAKAITQANRAKHKAPYEFGEGHQLPSTIPHGFNEKLSNRIFKRRVIDMVCNRIAEHVTVGSDPAADNYTRKLIIDYTGCPILFEAPPAHAKFDVRSPTFMADVPPMGEADIKFLRWADHFSATEQLSSMGMIAFSIDGDFLPIALMRYEEQTLALKLFRQQQQKSPLQPGQPQPPSVHQTAAAGGPLQPGQSQPPPVHRIAAADGPSKPDQSLPPPVHRIAAADGPSKPDQSLPPPVHRIAIYRIKYKTPEVKQQQQKNKAKKALQEAEPCKKQRLLTPCQQSGALGLAAPITAAEAPAAVKQQERPSTKAREFEYVDIPALYRGMSTVFASLFPSTVPRNPLHRYHYMRILAGLMGLSGTDFSRGLPYVGPTTLWGLVRESQDVFAALLDAYDMRTGQFRPGLGCGLFAARVYMGKFASHFRSASSHSKATDADAMQESDEEESCDSDDGDQSGASSFRAVVRALQASSLSDKVRSDLPSAERVLVTFRNINWILQYWKCAEPAGLAAGAWDYSRCYPDPVCKDFGFKYATGNRKGSNKGSDNCSARSAAASVGNSVKWWDDK